MADVEFTTENLVSLAGRLSEIDPPLSDEEQKLLVAIFAAAVGRSKKVPSEESGTLPGTELNPPGDGQEDFSELQKQLLNSYIPGIALTKSNHGFYDRITG